MIPDNIIVGVLVENLTPGDLGILPSEETMHIPFHENGDTFLPKILVELKLFKSTSEIKNINKQRLKSIDLTKFPEQDLWRSLTRPEMTKFKIGKRVFWLIVGEGKVVDKS